MTRQRRSNRTTVTAAMSAMPRVVMAEFLESRRLLSAVSNPSAFALDELAYAQGDGPSPTKANALPQGYSPAQITGAYGIDNVSFGGSVTGTGAGQTIAIIDAYDNPNLVDTSSSAFNSSDLFKFDAAMDLPNPPSFTKINQTGGTVLPAVDDGWANEEALDVEWTHAIAPDANIVLVEANSTQLSDLLDGAAAYAAGMPGVSVVTMSFADTEFYGENQYDSDLLTPSGHQGVTFIAASGDVGGVVTYPAASPNVVSVGATTLFVSSGDSYDGEVAYNDSGGGISADEAKPAYQVAVTQSNSHRTVPDVSINGNQSTGLSVYDSLNGGTNTPWFKIGGTSACAPVFAGLIAIANQGRFHAGLGTLNGLTQTLPRLYELNRADFNDITSGSNGNSAGAGYDLASGLGSPIANKLIPDLAGGATLSGTVFSDPSGSGVHSSGDSGLSGYTVYLDLYGGGTLEGDDPTALSTSNGSFQFTDLPGGTFALRQTVPAGVDLTTPVSQSVTLSYDSTVTGKYIGYKPTGAAAQLVFFQQPTTVIVGDVITPAITVDVEDASGGIVTDDSLVTLSVATGGGSIGGTLSVNAVNGVATFSDISISSTGSESITATDGSLTSATSSTFTVDPVPPVIGSATQLQFSQQPFPVTAQSDITPAITIQVQDSNGNLVDTDTSPVTLSIASGPAGGTLGGTLTVNASGGIATFSNITASVAGTYTLTATDGALASATSSTFVVSQIVYIPAKLVVAQSINAAYIGSPISPSIVVNVEDPNGVLVTTDDSAVTLSINTGPTGATLGGTVSVYAVNGVATFSDITVSEVGNYTLTATDGALTPYLSNSFTATIEGNIAPSIIASSLPTAAVGGAKIRGSVVVNETNLATKTATGTVITSIYASDNGSLVLLGTLSRKMTVVVKKTYLATVPINAIPASLSGNYSIVAMVTDLTGNHATSLAGASLDVAAPFIALTPTITKMTLPAAVVSGSKSTAVVTLSLANNGNVPSIGNSTIGIYASPDGLATDATLIATLTRKLFIPVGKSAAVTVPLKLIPATLAGDYKILAQVTDPDSNITSVVSASTVNFAAPFVAFTLSAITETPASVAIGDLVTMTITVQNTGNIAATGPATIQLGVSSDGISQLSQLTTITKSETIASGKQVVLKLRFSFYIAVTPGTYFPFVTYTQEGMTTTAAGSGTLTIT